VNDDPPPVEEGGPHDRRAAAQDDGAPVPSRAPPTQTSFPPGYGESADPSLDPDSTLEPSFPWPPAEGVGVLAAAGRTWRESVFDAASFFRRMPDDAPLGPALVYLVGVTVLASGIQLFWDMLLLAVRPPGDGAGSLFLPTSPRQALITFFFSPFVMLAALFVGAGVWHIVLRILGGARGRYGTTARVFAYAQGPQLFAIVPFLGTLVGGVWGLAIAVIGLREAHRTTTGKAVAAVLIPILLLFGLFFVFALLIAAGALLLQAPV
jgi:hypothetical protein